MVNIDNRGYAKKGLAGFFSALMASSDALAEHSFPSLSLVS
jgi:hypothetical protein